MITLSWCPRTRASRILWLLEEMIETLEKGLARGPWLLGERFSAADVMVGSSVYFMRLFGILPDNPVLST